MEVMLKTQVIFCYALGFLIYLPLKIKSKKCIDLKIDKIEYVTLATLFAWDFDVYYYSGYIYASTVCKTKRETKNIVPKKITFCNDI